MITRILPLLLVLASQYAFAAQPLEPIILGPTGGNVSDTATAFAGGKYLTVWRQLFMPGTGIWGAFSDMDGKPLGPGFAVIPETNALNLRLFAEKDSFLLYWNDSSRSAAFARIEPSGEVSISKRLDFQPILRFDAFVDGRAMAVTTIWNSEGVIVDSTGQVIRRGLFPGTSWPRRTAFAGLHSFFLTGAAPDLVLSRYSLDGELLNTFTIQKDQCQTTNSPCDVITSVRESESGSILLAMHDVGAASGRPPVATMTIAGDGTLSERHAIPTMTGASPQIRRIGARTWLVLTSMGETEALIIDEKGLPGGDPVRLTDRLDEPLVLTDGPDALFAATSPLFAQQQVQTFLFREMQPVNPQLLSITPTIQDNTQVASNGHEFLAVWTDTDGIGWPELHWAVLDATGERKSPVFAGGGSLVPNSLVSNGRDYLMLLTAGQAGPLIARRVASDGTLLGDTTITSRTTYYGWPAVAASVPTTPGYLIAWADGSVYATVLTDSGVSGEPLELIRPNPEPGYYIGYEGPALAWDGRHALLAVQRRKEEFIWFPGTSNPTFQVQAYRLAADGQLQAGKPIVLPGNGYQLRSASSGLEFMVAAGGEYFVIAADNSIKSFSPRKPPIATDLVWDGTSYVLVSPGTVEWLARNGTSLAVARNAAMAGNVEAAVDSAGHLVFVASELKAAGPLRAVSYIPSDLSTVAQPNRRRAAGH